MRFLYIWKLQRYRHYRTTVTGCGLMNLWWTSSNVLELPLSLGSYTRSRHIPLRSLQMPSWLHVVSRACVRCSEFPELFWLFKARSRTVLNSTLLMMNGSSNRKFIHGGFTQAACLRAEKLGSNSFCTLSAVRYTRRWCRSACSDLFTSRPELGEWFKTCQRLIPFEKQRPLSLYSCLRMSWVAIRNFYMPAYTAKVSHVQNT